MSESNRRDLIKMIGGVAGVGVATTLMLRAEQVPPATPGSPAKLRNLPWPYQPLDPDAVAQRAFESYKKAHCMYGSLEAIVGSTADQLGEPYTSFPFLLFKFGAGGINGWGTVCGAISGAAAAFQMLSPKPEPLIDTLFTWYEAEPLPNFYPKGARFPEIRSVSDTPLCHTSVAKWCEASKKHTYSPERIERCGTLAASVAREAVLLLNEQVSKKPLTVITIPVATQNCMACHEQGGMVENTRGKMNCGGCHSPLIGKHPS